VVFLAGLVIFLVSGPDRPRTLRILRPFTGVLILCLLVLPWWLLLQQKLKLLNVDIAQTQLSGSLLRNLASVKELASAYYLRTLFGLMLPISLAAPFLIPRLWNRWRPADESMRLLIYVSLLLLVVFTVGGHYRKHYMLPLLPVCALFLARAIGCGADQGLGRVGRRILYGVILALGVALLGLIAQERAYLSLAWLLLSALPVVALVMGLQEEADMKPYAVQLVPVLIAITILTTGYTAFFPSSMDRWRFAVQGFAQQVGRTLQPGDAIVQWKSNSPILPYFAKRPVVRFDEWKPLAAYYSGHAPGQRVFAVIPKQVLPEFLANFEGQTLQSVENRRHPEKDLVFVRLTGLKGAPPSP
jgi:4-amino-4-deoxy-L-arabinose transferase-like glycosyltransferase